MQDIIPDHEGGRNNLDEKQLMEVLKRAACSRWHVARGIGVQTRNGQRAWDGVEELEMGGSRDLLHRED